MKLLEVVSEVVQTEVYLVAIPTVVIHAVVSYCWSFCSLVHRVFVPLEVVG